MARMSIDDSVLRDPRITILSQLTGWSRRETLGCLLEVWAICYDRVDYALGPKVIDMIAGREGFADLLIEAELAVAMPSGKLRIAGAKERITYLSKLKQFGREGGLKSGESRRNNTKGSTKPPANGTVNDTANLIPNTLVPDLASASALVPDLSEKNSASPSGSGLPPGKRKPKPSEPTPAEMDSVKVVLEKLTARNGIRYSGSHEHTRLIVNQLRAGVSELDLRAVIAYCAVELFADEDMQKYLRPETLFGPRTIAKYLDPARTWAAKTYPQEFTITQTTWVGLEAQ